MLGARRFAVELEESTLREAGVIDHPSMRLPRVFQSVPVTWKSSPRARADAEARSGCVDITATDDRLRDQYRMPDRQLDDEGREAQALGHGGERGINVNGSMNGLSSKCRSPSGVYGYLLSETSG